ncbi:MAG: hypothetical protein JO061_24075 [Acidobacteriaceae bacterium]|nr:hypothetical protein [Acidobacteriaceae bacterium]
MRRGVGDVIEDLGTTAVDNVKDFANGLKIVGAALITYITEQNPTAKPNQPQQQPATAPQPQNAEHTQGARPGRSARKDKHEKTRSGDKQPPNYVPDRQYMQPKPKKSNQPAPRKVHKNKYKKEDTGTGGSS